MATKEERRKRLLVKFREVARERLAKIDGAFGRLESGGKDSALVDEMMREVHTLKGEARLMGFQEVSRTAHITEDLLAWAQGLGFRLPQQASDLVYGGLDLARALLEEDGDGSGLRERASDLESKAGALISAPGDEPREDEVPHDTGPRLPEPPAGEPGSSGVPSRDSARDFVRIHRDSLAELTLVASELALHQEVISRLLSAPRGERHGPLGGGAAGDLCPDDLRAARDADFEVRVRIEQLHEQIRRLRLQRLESLFERYPPAIRELGRECGKSVRVRIEGAMVSVDKQVLDQIDESLLHLVRNAVDHGLEPPAEREKMGKSAHGNLILGARQLGSQVEIWVEDDGRGLRPEMVREVADAKGLLTEERSWDDEEVLQLVFEPGFSTKSSVTDISGRGVGLDVVKARVESLGGSVRLSSRVARGTKFTMRLPISVALSQSLLFRTSRLLLALPSSRVAVVARPAPEEVERVGCTPIIRLDEDPVPILDLAVILGRPSVFEGGAMGSIVVMEHEGQRLGLMVEEVVGERQTVHQPLGAFLERTRLVGAAVLVDGGEVGLVLNSAEITRMWGEGDGVRLERSREGAKEEGRRRRVLVVDDSELTRDMLTGTLRRFDLEIGEAVNGREALELVRDTSPDLVLTDLDMPVMDGLQLIESLRAEALTKEIPIVVLSTRGSEEDKRRAMKAGADAYLVKMDFEEAKLRRLLERFIEA